MGAQRIAGQAKAPSARNGPGKCVQKKKKKERNPVLEMHSEIFMDSIMLFLDFASKIFHYRVRVDGAIKEIRIILS